MFYGNLLIQGKGASPRGSIEKEFSENDRTQVYMQAVLETVAKITHEKGKSNDTRETNGTKSFQLEDVFNLENEDSDDITTLIDNKDNEFVMLNKKSKYPVLKVDLR